MLIKDMLVSLLAQAVAEAQRQQLLPVAPLPEVVVERPQNPEHGDYATNLPLKLARAARMPPMAIAQCLVPLIQQDELLRRVWAAPPGFVNFELQEQWLAKQVEAIRTAGSSYGSLELGNRARVQVEFVSVNPTGPIHVGHTRGAVLGSTLATVLSAAGYHATREYYINDAGSQMELFARSLYVRYLQALGKEAQLPEGGYQGEYVVELGRRLAQEYGDRFLHVNPEEALKQCQEIGLERMLKFIREDLAAIGVEFDTWFSERSLFQGGQYQKAMELLRKGGHLVEREGATWFTSTALGEDKDNVLVRSSGAPTYFASDVAYHYNKFVERRYQRVINIWGADHQGHVSRMKAVIGALDVPQERLHIIIAQMVTLKRGGELFKASKRAGEFITLRELVDEVGSDACRFFFLSRSPESQMEFDLELAKTQSEENPVYYVQYAHARIASILRNAQEHGLDWRDGDVALLGHPAELDLLRKMVRLPELVENVARTLEPHHLPHYAMELATAFHWFYQQCRVISSNPEELPITKARLKLVEAARIVLARTLQLMGVTAPEKM